MTHAYESIIVIEDRVLLEIRRIRHFKGLYDELSGFRSTVGDAQGSDCVVENGPPRAQGQIRRDGSGQTRRFASDLLLLR
jgi:hypothetical protein